MHGRKLNLRRRPRRALMTLLLVPALILAISAVAFAAQGQKTSGVVYAGVTHSEGDDLYVSGDFKDKLLGRGAIVYVTRISSPVPGTIHVTARKITIYTPRGSLTGKGEADETLNPDGTGTVSNGVFNLTKGTGKYKDHTFAGKFDGDYADGVYTFNYTGKYK
jgi:hypothetical protein